MSYILSERDYRRFQELLRWYERNKRLHPPQPRRHGKTGSGSGGATRKAYCKTDAGAGSTIVCYLDTDGTGDEITVNCSIAGGGNLNAALPQLTDSLLIFVTKIGGTWYCTTVFQALGDGLEVSGGKLTIKLNGNTLAKSATGLKGNYQGGTGVDITGNVIKGDYTGGNGIDITGATITADIDTTELQFESGKISTKLDEC